MISKMKDSKEGGTRLEMIKDAFRSANVEVTTALFKVILMALAERDESADICTDAKGYPEPDPELRDYESVPLKEDVDEYIMKREVLPHVPDAWVDESKTKVGYEINFNRYFYKYTEISPLVAPVFMHGEESGVLIANIYSICVVRLGKGRCQRGSFEECKFRVRIAVEGDFRAGDCADEAA